MMIPNEHESMRGDMKMNGSGNDRPGLPAEESFWRRRGAGLCFWWPPFCCRCIVALVT